VRRRERHWLAPRLVAGGLITLALLAAALFAPLLAPQDPLAQDLLYGFVPPSWLPGGDPAYLLGTDSLGRDVLSRLIWGARTAATVAIAAASLAALLGTALGLLAGYVGGAADHAVSRLIDVWMAFPPVLLSIVLVAMVGTGLGSVILAIVVVDWTRFARIVRAEVQAQRARDYVVAARTMGLAPRAIVFGEILPNLWPLLLTLLTMEMGIAIVVEAILSFVGLSVSSDTPTWGGMIAEGRQAIHQAWWLMSSAIAVLIVVVIGLNLLGDGIRRAVDPLERR
jgi:dipeptide transport system permease protein